MMLGSKIVMSAWLLNIKVGAQREILVGLNNSIFIFFNYDFQA
jgi:hypothetical protein